MNAAHAAVMMCSSATSFHALNKARFQPGERVAVFGLGGLGQSAVQLALAGGASAVYAVDVNPAKAELAAHYGAIPVKGGPEAVAGRRGARRRDRRAGEPATGLRDTRRTRRRSSR